MKAIITRSGVAYEGPSIPPTFSSPLKEEEREPKVTKDKLNPKSSIPYPSRLNDQKLREKTNSQMLKFLQIFQRLHFDLSFADTLLHISNGPPKKLPENFRDLGRFLIPCDFQGLESCMALADLGASINLMPLSVWKKLSLPDLTPTRMTLELATRSFAYPVGIAEDVFVQVGKFTFLADFVVVDYDVNPCIPLILGRLVLRTACALVDVHGEELILRDGDEKLIFHADSTPKHPHKHRNESINMINFIGITCEDHFPKVLKFKKSNHPSSGSTTLLSDFSPSLTPFETSDSLLEEFADELALLDPFPPRNEDDNKFTDEPVIDYSPPSGDDDLLENDSTLPEEPSESSEIATLSSSPFENKDK
nr:hypothetical protein [Tanacetum cinerariifolium]